MSKPVILLAGPTASGKSALAMELAERFDGIVINADSMQVYAELRIITARPPLEDEERVPHRLYGVLPAAERCSVGRWLTMARSEIDAALAADKMPILVGGTGLYFSALTDGLAEIPEIASDVRAQFQKIADEQGPAALHAILRERDPEMAARLKPGDPQRLIRALEVLEATGRSLVQWQSGPNGRPALDLPWLGFALLPERQLVYDACDRRFRQMVGEGGLEEVAALAKLGLDPSLPAMKALGVPDLMAYLAGEKDLETAIISAQTGTRRYAKRQMTWIRNKMIAWNRIILKDSERNYLDIFAKISETLLTLEK